MARWVPPNTLKTVTGRGALWPEADDLKRISAAKYATAFYFMFKEAGARKAMIAKRDAACFRAISPYVFAYELVNTSPLVKGDIAKSKNRQNQMRAGNRSGAVAVGRLLLCPPAPERGEPFNLFLETLNIAEDHGPDTPRHMNPVYVVFTEEQIIDGALKLLPVEHVLDASLFDPSPLRGK